MTDESRRRKAVPPPTTCAWSGRSSTWISDEEEARGSSIAEFGRCGRRSDPRFSESENDDCASFSKISDSSIFESKSWTITRSIILLNTHVKYIGR